MAVHYISPEKLTFGTIQEIFDKEKDLALSDEARTRIEKGRTYLDEKIKNASEPLYGITTGFGALHKKTISNTQLSQLQQNLLVSHATGVGQELSPHLVRMMLFLKAHALALGHSGVQLQTVERIVTMFNRNMLPVVYDRGSLGASGDLAPLAHLFLPLLGLGEVYLKGKRMPAAQALEQMNLSPLKLQSKEGLALLNGTQFMSAHGVCAILQAQRLLKRADLTAALSLDAYDGRIDPFMEAIQTARPHQGQIATAQAIREMLEGSELLARNKQHVQDPYSFRCVPQVHGATKDAVNYAKSVLLTEINAVTDNPTVFPDLDRIVSGGNFHGQPLALSYDFAAIALAELASIAERRIYRLISGERGLPEFLIANPGLNSGFMMPQYTAASLVSQNKQLCWPASVDSIPSSNEQEDHVSMGANSATKLLKVLYNCEYVTAIEFFNAAQALEFRRPHTTSALLEKTVQAYRRHVSFIKNDRELYPEMHNTKAFLYGDEVRQMLDD